MDQLKRECPGGAICELMKRAGELWRTATQERKEHYQKMADEDKLRYRKEESEWKARSIGNVKGGVIVNGKKVKKGQENQQQVNGEKKPGLTTSFMVFCGEKREEYKKTNPTIKPVDVSQMAGIAWKSLTDAQRQAYKDKAEAINVSRGLRTNVG